MQSKKGMEVNESERQTDKKGQTQKPRKTESMHEIKKTTKRNETKPEKQSKKQRTKRKKERKKEIKKERKKEKTNK